MAEITLAPLDVEFEVPEPEVAEVPEVPEVQDLPAPQPKKRGRPPKVKAPVTEALSELRPDAPRLPTAKPKSESKAETITSSVSSATACGVGLVWNEVVDADADAASRQTTRIAVELLQILAGTHDF